MNVWGAIINVFRFNRTNWKAVGLCIVAATVFWFFNALNKEHTATIAYPLEFRYDAENFIAVKKLPTQVPLNITGSGWDLLRKSLWFKVTPLQIYLEKPVEVQKIPPATVLPLALAQMGQTKINHVAGDTLHIRIEPRQTKRVKLAIAENQLRFELGFGLASEIKLTPDSVLIDGPQSYMKKLSDTLLLPFRTARLSQNVKEELDIHSPAAETIRVTPAAVNVSFEVDELQDITMPVRVMVLPAAPFHFQVSLDSTRMVARIPKKLKNKITDAVGIVALIDLRSLDAGISKVWPEVKGLPPFAELLMVDSVTIRKY